MNPRISIVSRLGIVIAIALMWAAGGCDTVKAPPAGLGDALPIESYPRIVATDKLQSALRFGAPKVDRSSASRPMLVTVPVRSITDRYALNIQYRFDFFDVNGRPLRSNQGWHFKHLEPRVQDFLEANALEVAATDWRLTIRSAR